MGVLSFPFKPSGSSSSATETEEQRLLYSKEVNFNFRWIAKFLATHSSHVLTADDLVPDDVQQELAELGVFVISWHHRGSMLLID